jgi:DNA-binding transcriptional regulator YdaS (Cro superfamily)
MNQIQRAIALVGSIAKLAAILGVTPQAVIFWRDGKRRLPVEACPAIERATSGSVTRQDLRPGDWMDIWPELQTAGSAEAPPTIAVPAGMALIPERRVATEPRRAVDRERDISQTGQGVA